VTTTDTTQQAPDDFTTAVAALTNAVRAANAGQGSDGAEIITRVLATVAANLDSTDALVQARPGSWEAAGVQELVHKTVGWDDEYLLTYRTEPIELVVDAVYELDDLDMFETYEASTNHIGRVMFGDRWTPARGNLTVDELEQIEDAEELLSQLEQRDRAEYQERFAATVQAEFEQLRASTPDRFPEQLTVTVRYADHTTAHAELTQTWTPGLAGQLYQHARENTPLPGSDTKPNWTIGQRHAETLIAAGHWPHLRIPALAHYGTPQPKDTDA